MQLKKIFGSGARVKLFRQFLMYPNDEFYIRELTRILDEQINSLRRELENLEKMGMLKSREKNRKKYYRINHHFPLKTELTSIIRKTNKSNKEFLKKVSDFGDIDILIMSGQFIGSNDGVDTFVVGEVDKGKLEAFLEETFPGRNLTYNCMTREDFLYRVALKDKFVTDMMSSYLNIIVKNKLKKDTEHFMRI